MKRGDLVLVSLPGDYGKPRPALVIQSDYFSEHSSITLLPLTSKMQETQYLRVTVPPEGSNGLRVVSQIMIDKASTVPSGRVRSVIGQIPDGLMLNVDRLLALFLGIVK